MTTKNASVSPANLEFLAQVKRDAELAGRVLRETGTLSATNTFAVAQRVPGEDKIVSTGFPGLWSNFGEVKASLITFEGIVLHSDTDAGGGSRYARIFRERPSITTVIHVHTPFLGGWAQSHRTFPIFYVAAQRGTLSREIPQYVDRRQAEADFILESLKKDPHLPAILEANGGNTFWGDGVNKVSQYILLLEEAAKFQTIAESLGGSKEYGPGVLEQQWARTGLLQAAIAANAIQPSAPRN